MPAVFKSKINRSIGGNIVIFIVLCFFGAFMALPFVYTVVTAFKPLDELFLFPPRFFVMKPTLQNFVDLFTLLNEKWVPFSRYVFNSFFITTVGCVGHIIFASMAAYPLAKIEFPGSKTFNKMIKYALMFPAGVTAIPSFLVLSYLGWINTYLSVIVPAFAGTLGLFLMRQYMNASIIDSILDSARIDGASEYRIWWSIVMPASKPAWLTAIIFTVQSLWGITGAGTIYNESLKTLPYALNQIEAGGIARAGVGAASALIMIVIPLLVFVISQSKVIETMGTSGLKE